MTRKSLRSDRARARARKRRNQRIAIVAMLILIFAVVGMVILNNRANSGLNSQSIPDLGPSSVTTDSGYHFPLPFRSRRLEKVFTNHCSAS